MSTNEAFRWTQADGAIGLGDFPGCGVESDARGVSADGSVVVGFGSYCDGNGEQEFKAFRWTPEEGLVDLGLASDTGGASSSASGVSDVGTVVVGSTGGEAFRWTQSGGAVGLGFLAGGVQSHASSVSANGSVVVGSGTSANSNEEAFRWIAPDGMLGLGDLPGGAFLSRAFGASADGSVVVGSGATFGPAPDGTTEAFIWDESSGMRNLRDVLIALGLDLEGWTLSEARDISNDGRTIVGSGINPSGGREAWLAQIPEPSTGFLFALGAGASMLMRPRRSRTEMQHSVSTPPLFG